MKITELRIGNYLNTKDGKLAIVEKITKDGFIAYSGMITKLPLSPIPLTEEWLLKFGFDILGNTTSHACFGENPITHDYMIKLIKTDKEWFYKNSYHKIKYVHQLQNLYFAITNTELNLIKD